MALCLVIIYEIRPSCESLLPGISKDPRLGLMISSENGKQREKLINVPFFRFTVT